MSRSSGAAACGFIATRAVTTRPLSDRSHVRTTARDTLAGAVVRMSDTCEPTAGTSGACAAVMPSPDPDAADIGLE